MSDSFVLVKRDICTEPGVINSLVHTNTRPPLHARFMYAHCSSIHSKNQQSLFQAKPQSKVTQRQAERVVISEQFPAVEWIGMSSPHPGWSTSPEASQLQAQPAWCWRKPGSGAEKLRHPVLRVSYGRLVNPPLGKKKQRPRPSISHTYTHICADTHAYAQHLQRRARHLCSPSTPPHRARGNVSVNGVANEMMSHTGRTKCRRGMETLYYVVLQVVRTTYQSCLGLF